MAPWWKRLLFSLASTVVAAVVCMAGVVGFEAVFQSHSAIIHSSEVVLTAGVSIALCLVGWVISSPVVLIVRDVRGLRFWIYWVLGSCVGPLLMLALFVLVYFVVPHGPNEQWIRPELMPLVYLAAAISSLTSLLHLLLLRRAQTKAGRAAR